MSEVRLNTAPKIQLTLSTEGDAAGHFDDYVFSAKVLPVGCDGGIDNGRVVSLYIDNPKDGLVVLYNSLREAGAWVKEPSDQNQEVYRQLLHALENLPDLLA